MLSQLDIIDSKIINNILEMNLSSTKSHMSLKSDTTETISPSVTKNNLFDSNTTESILLSRSKNNLFDSDTTESLSRSGSKQKLFESDTTESLSRSGSKQKLFESDTTESISRSGSKQKLYYGSKNNLLDLSISEQSKISKIAKTIINVSNITNPEVIRYCNTIKKYTKINEVNIYLMIKDTIKNGRALSDLELNYLNNLSSDEKIEIIKLYNQMYSDLIKLHITH